MVCRRVAPLYRSQLTNHDTVCGHFMGHKGFSAEVGRPGKYVPVTPSPESAISALAKAVEYSNGWPGPKARR